MTQLETRNLEVRKVNQETRSITGLAVTWADIAEVAGYKERFERGSIGNVEGVKLFDAHKEIIGKVVRGADTEDGYEIEAVISKTARGNDVYEMLKDGTLDRFSVGFIPKESREDGDVLVRTAVDLKEVSVVPFPAYAGAQVSEVRSDSKTNLIKEVNDETSLTNNQMDNINTNDLVTRSDFEVLERSIELIKENVSTTEAPATQFRSAGEFLKALAANDENARTEVRAYTGATLSDSHTSNDWKADVLNIVDKGRPVLNLFDRGPLGAQGNSVEYPRVKAVSGDVAVQAAEGDDLAYLKVEIETATAPVKTYGGYSEISRQAIERSDVAYLDAVLKHQAASYAKVTNKAVLDAIAAATPQTGQSFTLSSATGDKFIGAVVDGVSKIEDNGSGATADFVFVSADVYAKLATLSDSAGRPLFNINGDGSNTIGGINVRGIAGSLAGLPVVMNASLSAKTFYVASSSAVTTWENSGAPLRLQDENIINLTKQFSLYGYMAVGVKNANGLVKATVA